MEDEVEERLFYQAYLSHVKMAAKTATTATAAGHWTWRHRLIPMTLRSDLVIITITLCVALALLQGLLLYGNQLFDRISRVAQLLASNRLAALPSSSPDLSLGDSEHLDSENLAAYAVRGRRSHMEDRFTAKIGLAGGQVTVAAVFDGHGGDAAAEYANTKLMPALCNKIEKAMEYAAAPDTAPPCPTLTVPPSPALARKKSFKKTVSGADDTGKAEITDPELLKKLTAVRSITRDAAPVLESTQVDKPAQCYVNSSNVDFGKMLTDELLWADQSLLKEFRLRKDISGSTALLAVVHKNKLTVANVGDSRGVMCDKKGNAIPLSFDHKPQQMREQKRIKEAGGFIAFLGVWRVAGILATSRALGDYPLKDKNYVIAEPDILTFNLSDHQPQFIILATDGLWDTFSNEEAVNFIKERFNEPFYGARSLVQQSYKRGSTDNITVMVINLKDQV